MASAICRKVSSPAGVLKEIDNGDVADTWGWRGFISGEGGTKPSKATTPRK
jgi:hypothetical protein